MVSKYLLYIDILGFADLAGSDPDAVRRIYKTVDSLNVHRHPGFKTIVFSDTILVYNDFEPTSDDEHFYAVMYSCEFAQDLMYQLVGTGVFFRGILTFGEFEHYQLENIQCFFGPALITAYGAEKGLPAHGLFITNECNRYNRIFPTARFDDRMRYVFLNQAFDRLQQDSGGRLPADSIWLDVLDTYRLAQDLVFLRSMLSESRDHKEPLVRAKHLATYDLFRQRYPVLLATLEGGRFSPDCVFETPGWSNPTSEFPF